MATIGVFAAIFDDGRRILLVRRAYPPFNWTLPGGRVEPRESPKQALIREVREETGYDVEVGEFVGAYSAPFKDDLVLFFECHIIARDGRHDEEEIAEVAFRAQDSQPDTLSSRTARRIADAFAGERGVIRIFEQ